MKKQMKATIVALMIISLFPTLAYSAPPSQPDITALVQEVRDLVLANTEYLVRIESKIDGLPAPVDNSAQLAGIQATVDSIPTKEYTTQLAGIQGTLDSVPIKDYTAQIFGLQTSVDLLPIKDYSAQLGGIQASIDALLGSADYTAQLSAIQASIDVLPAPSDYSAQLAGIQASINAMPSPVDYSSQLSSLQSTADSIETKVDTLQSSVDGLSGSGSGDLSGIPIMVADQGGWEGTLAPGEIKTVYLGEYPSIADVQVTMIVGVPYDSKYGASVKMSADYIDYNGNPMSATFDAGHVTSVMPNGIAYTFNFNSERCVIQIARGATEPIDTVVGVYYTVTAKYIP